jgi:hypothetical protein
MRGAGGGGRVGTQHIDMSDLTTPTGRLTICHALMACLFIAFDFATILPTAAGCYVIKRSLNIDVFRGMDMLPDPLIEGLLRGIWHGIRNFL